MSKSINPFAAERKSRDCYSVVWRNFICKVNVFLTIFVEKVMFPKSLRHVGRVENMDEYLQGLGLWRKVIPKDGASLYRVVAEKVRLRRNS